MLDSDNLNYIKYAVHILKEHFTQMDEQKLREDLDLISERNLIRRILDLLKETLDDSLKVTIDS